jgi:hypothetical protein
MTYNVTSRDVILRVEDKLGCDYARLVIDGKEVRRYDAQYEGLSSCLPMH